MPKITSKKVKQTKGNRKCKICGSNLSRYNPGDECFCHSSGFAKLVPDRPWKHNGCRTTCDNYLV
jgi:hypothetical protein